MMNEAFSFIAFTLAPFGLLAMGFIIYNLITTPVKIYSKQNREIEKYNWRGVQFFVTQFSIPGMSGWALQVTNGKDFDLSQVEIRLTQIRVDLGISKASQIHHLGYIDRNDETIKFDPIGIEHGREKDFPITSIVRGILLPKRGFVTTPDDMNWVFPDVLLSVPKVIIQIEVRGKTIAEDEINSLPTKTMSIQIIQDASISIMEAATDDQQTNPTQHPASK